MLHLWRTGYQKTDIQFSLNIVIFKSLFRCRHPKITSYLFKISALECYCHYRTLWSLFLCQASRRSGRLPYKWTDIFLPKMCIFWHVVWQPKGTQEKRNSNVEMALFLTTCVINETEIGQQIKELSWGTKRYRNHSCKACFFGKPGWK